MQTLCLAEKATKVLGPDYSPKPQHQFSADSGQYIVSENRPLRKRVRSAPVTALRSGNE